MTVQYHFILTAVTAVTRFIINVLVAMTGITVTLINDTNILSIKQKLFYILSSVGDRDIKTK